MALVRGPAFLPGRAFLQDQISYQDQPSYRDQASYRGGASYLEPSYLESDSDLDPGPDQDFRYPDEPYAGRAQYRPGRRARKVGTSGWAIASFATGLFGFITIMFGLIFGVVALRSIRRSGQKGRGYAITGILLSCCWAVIVALIAANTGLLGKTGGTSASGSPSPVYSSPGGINPFSLKVGDCFNNPTSAGTTLVTAITVIPCTKAHNAQTFAKLSLTGDKSRYPGDKAITLLATKGCEAGTGSIDMPKTTKAMTLHFLFPTSANWGAGERRVICMIVNPTSSLTSTLLKSGAPG